ncbi:hypothetical protein BV25DRAFT_874854 [Artomyces pyxidatus]|uniref:Uncharacterized protein n=1 Tax=Artomyces pyxidatus TaxID=48021 RepID=A0ACB8THF8_9AGAM|nr:hypothetical protein BV25DRAFT_874854 [Artomyces pyxidatus]
MRSRAGSCKVVRRRERGTRAKLGKGERERSQLRQMRCCSSENSVALFLRPTRSSPAIPRSLPVARPVSAQLLQPLGRPATLVRSLASKHPRSTRSTPARSHRFNIIRSSRRVRPHSTRPVYPAMHHNHC